MRIKAVGKEWPKLVSDETKVETEGNQAAAIVCLLEGNEAMKIHEGGKVEGEGKVKTEKEVMGDHYLVERE
ncbi:hypothetical protein SUGI_1525000, partial [Cryptomeria japonica]